MSELNDIWNSGKGRLSEDKLVAYMEGRLSPEEQHEVEAWLSEEGMEADALEGLKELPVKETKDAVSRLNYTLHQKLNKKNRRRSKHIKDNNWAWIAVVVILLLCVVGYIVLKYSLTN